MKTSELKKWLEDNDFWFIEKSGYIETLDLMKVYTTVQAVTFENYSYGSERSFSLLKIIVEYCSTPLNEREDEKKYLIKLFEKANTGLETKYLKYDTSKMKFYFSDNVNENNQFKTTFTQSDIDNFPKEIKGAIECGFLRKSEVKWVEFK